MRKTVVIAVLTCILALMPVRVSALESANEYKYLPDSVTNYLEDQPDQPLSSTVTSALESLKEELGHSIRVPASLLAGAVSVTFAVSAAKNLIGHSSSSASEFLVGAASALMIMKLVLGTIKEYLLSVSEAMENAGELITRYLPTLVGVLVSGGKPGAAAVEASFGSALAILLFSAASSVVPALSSSMLCLAAVASLSGFVSRAAKAAKKLVCWLVAAATAASIGIYKLQFAAAAAGDSIALKTGRYVVKGTVPLVGSTISGAMGAMFGASASAGTTVAVAGICSLLLLFLPLIVMGLAIGVSLRLSSFAAETFGSECTRDLLDAVRAVVEVNTAFMAGFFSVVLLAMSSVARIGIS